MKALPLLRRLLVSSAAVLCVQAAPAAQPPAPPATSGSPSSCVKLLRSEPFPPDQAPLPRYPAEAQSAGVEGNVSFHFDIGSGCAPEDITIDDGPAQLRDAVNDAVPHWQYCGVPEGQEIHATLAFQLTCSAP